MVKICFSKNYSSIAPGVNNIADVVKVMMKDMAVSALQGLTNAPSLPVTVVM